MGSRSADWEDESEEVNGSHARLLSSSTASHSWARDAMESSHGSSRHSLRSKSSGEESPSSDWALLSNRGVPATGNCRYGPMPVSPDDFDEDDDIGVGHSRGNRGVLGSRRPRQMMASAASGRSCCCSKQGCTGCQIFFLLFGILAVCAAFIFFLAFGVSKQLVDLEHRAPLQFKPVLEAGSADAHKGRDIILHRVQPEVEKVEVEAGNGFVAAGHQLLVGIRSMLRRLRAFLQPNTMKNGEHVIQLMHHAESNAEHTSEEGREQPKASSTSSTTTRVTVYTTGPILHLDIKQCGQLKKNIDFVAKDFPTSSHMPAATAAVCCARCEADQRCGAWTWGEASDVAEKNGVCFMKELLDGYIPQEVHKKGFLSGFPPRTLKTAKARPLNASEVAEQDGALLKPGSTISLYAVGSSSMLWMTWVEQLHYLLLRLGYKLPTVSARMKPEFHPRSVQTCDDSLYFDHLRTARFARIGWCSWDYAYEGWDSCQNGTREIGGHQVKCQHGPGCKHSMNPIYASEIAEDASKSNITVISTWFNDDQQKWSNFHCFGGASIHRLAAVALTIPSLLNTIRSIHARNPNVWIVVMGKYPQVPGHVSLPYFKEINRRVREALAEQPRTVFVDYFMPPDKVAQMYQFSHVGHPNCRGSKIMAHAVLHELFQHQVISRSLRLLYPVEAHVVNFRCHELHGAACHSSAVCWVDPADQRCKPYSMGSRELHSIDF